MAVKFFGQYLVENGIVSRESLVHAIELQESVNLSFGGTALELGFMSEAEIERVNLAQRNQDERFGDLAVKLGFLSQEQMQQILAVQKVNHLYIGEALVRVGGLAAEELPRHLEAFKADQSVYVTDNVAIPAGVPEPAMWEMTADLTYKMLTRVARLNFHAEPCRITNRLSSNEVVASMDFSGDVRGTYLIAVSAATRKQIAKAILNEENVDTEPQEVLDDTVMEFVNVVCGNVAAKAAQLGKNMEIAPPEISTAQNGLDVPAGAIGLLFPIRMADGELAELAIFVK